MLTSQEEHWDQDQRGWKEVRADDLAPAPGLCRANDEHGAVLNHFFRIFPPPSAL